MIDIIQALEEVLGDPLEESPKPIVLLLDEVQYLPDWALGLKVIYDRCPNIFILATGPSALSLQTNPDVARRADVVKIHPLSLGDFVNIYQTHRAGAPKPSPTKIGSELAAILLQSTTASDLMSNPKKDFS